jgi:hypothetical protein
MALNLLKIAVAIAILGMGIAVLEVLQAHPETSPLEPADEARLAILQQAISRMGPGRSLVCVGVWAEEADPRPRNPSPQLLRALHFAGRIVPITDCVDDDQKNGQKPDAFFLEAERLEWQADGAVTMTVDAWCSRLAGASTLWTARRTAEGVWAAARLQPESDAEPIG